MSRAQGNLDQDQGEEAGKEQEEALADLEDAQDELEEARRDAEEQLAVEQLARMGDQLKSLAERQEKVVAETASYEALRQKSRGQADHRPACRGQRARARSRAGLKEETAELTENLEGAPVFALTLRRAAKSMETSRRAASGAQDRQADRSRPPRPLRSVQAAPRIAQGRMAGGGGKAAAEAAAAEAVAAAAAAAMATASRRPPSSRCSSRSSKKSTTGPRPSTSCNGATRR